MAGLMTSISPHAPCNDRKQADFHNLGNLNIGRIVLVSNCTRPELLKDRAKKLMCLDVFVHLFSVSLFEPFETVLAQIVAKSVVGS